MEDHGSDVPKAKTPWWVRLRKAVVKGVQIGSFMLNVERLLEREADASWMTTVTQLASAMVHAVLDVLP
ncbi:hypothetical protein LTT66_11850 [Nocardia gipuzkoensis]|uniref:hypothetical protein n=1 Tax=Nocardia TaxID=1817 RepID=UPI001E542576|nr:MULTISPECIES: hypothetical protein [Nocardia]UGT70796.1 hypothetical protein LTT66_11850 [Nocardia gipuzkoensis]